MSRITLMDICDGIADTFRGEDVTIVAAGAPVRVYVQSYDELTEGMNDPPLLQVYPVNSNVAYTGETDRFTMKGCIRPGEYTFHLDAYPRQRSHISEDFEGLVRMWDWVESILEDVGGDCDGSAGECVYFGVAGVKNIAWATERMVFDYAGALFVGTRTTLTVRVF